MIVLIVLGILILGLLSYFLFFQNKVKCDISDTSKCDRVCNGDSDCKVSACTCVNKDQVVTNKEGIMRVCERIDCSCINNLCENQ